MTTLIQSKEVDLLEYAKLPSSFYQIAPSQNVAVGRPVFDGKDENVVVAKLHFAFSIDATVKEACFYADISTDSYYRYCNKYPEFRNKIELIKTKTNLLARAVIHNMLARGDGKTAMWYLERKSPEEYSPNVSAMFQLRNKQKRIEYLENLLRENGINFNY
jgi:hypothetical protein